MKVTAPFRNGEKIPEKFSCEGENVNPKLVLGDVPEKTKSLAVIMEDPDAPSGTFVHWVVFDIPPMKELPEHTRAGVDGIGTTGRPGYHGPCPPPGHGPHRYFFKVYALDAMLGLRAGSDKAGLEKAMEGHVLARAEIMGTYER